MYFDSDFDRDIVYNRNTDKTASVNKTKNRNARRWTSVEQKWNRRERIFKRIIDFDFADSTKKKNFLNNNSSSSKTRNRQPFVHFLETGRHLCKSLSEWFFRSNSCSVVSLFKLSSLKLIDDLAKQQKNLSTKWIHQLFLKLCRPSW